MLNRSVLHIMIFFILTDFMANLSDNVGQLHKIVSNVLKFSSIDNRFLRNIFCIIEFCRHKDIFACF